MCRGPTRPVFSQMFLQSRLLDPSPRQASKPRAALPFLSVRTPVPLSSRRSYVCGLNRRSRRLLLTTNADETAIAAPASIGLSSPAAASGSAAML